MAKPCPICIHSSRLAIEQAILNAKPHTRIAKDFGFTYTRRADGVQVGDNKVIKRHIDHMGSAYQTAMEEREVRSGVAMAARLEFLDEKVNTVLDRAEKGYPVVVGDVPLLDDEGRQVMRHDDRLLLAAIREGRANVELMAKLAGSLPENDEAAVAAIRRHLDSPEARRLLARLDELAAQESNEAGSRSGE